MAKRKIASWSSVSPGRSKTKRTPLVRRFPRYNCRKLQAVKGAITYRVSELPAGLSFDAADAATRTISGTPEAATDGAVEVTYTAQDSAGAATLTFSITVNPR